MEKRCGMAAALLSSAALVLAGCGGGNGTSDAGADSTTGASIAGIDVAANVDPDAGTVTLPMDRFTATSDEQLTVELAREAAFTTCARQQGIPWPATVKYTNDPTNNMWNRYGPWTPWMAEKFAFVEPQSDASLVRNGIVSPPEGYTEPEGEAPAQQVGEDLFEQANAACQSAPDVAQFEVAKFDNMSGPWSDELTQAEEAAEKSPEYEKAFEDLKTCYSDAGLTYDEDAERPGYPVGAKEYPDTVEGELVEVVPGEPPTVSQDRVPDTAITEDQIEMALKVADCQQSTDFTQHIADIYANAQAPVIKKYAAELTAGREKIDSLLAAANDDMATHPDAFSDPT